MRRSFLAMLVIFWVIGVRPAWANFEGVVIRIIYGDTIDVLVDRKPVRVRLAQIDAPEKRQAFGTRSRQVLAELTFRQYVTVVEAGHDRYGRVIGMIYVAGVDVNAEMVRLGMAWVYRQYATDRRLYVLESEARAGRRGLWLDPSPVPPWQFRRQ